MGSHALFFLPIVSSRKGPFFKERLFHNDDKRRSFSRDRERKTREKKEREGKTREKEKRERERKREVAFGARSHKMNIASDEKRNEK